jgi:pyridoxamine 5'-phosphate oxidase
MGKNISDIVVKIRKDYCNSSLNESELESNPMRQFELWMQQAINAEMPEVNAMTISTVGASGIPSSRIVLLRGVDDLGFTFYTNYESHKGKDMANNPFVALNFFWPLLERQIRIVGKIEKVSEKESDDYFGSRPKESQIGAWASKQSSVIKNRGEVEERYNFYEKEFENVVVTRPPHWGGYLVIPTQIEFWQGRPGRLHDRIQYNKHNDLWKIERLSP